MTIIETRRERRRGCGFRKPGGLYLVMPPAPMRPCGRLPLRLDRCPTCGGGIKATRGWTWIQPAGLFARVPCQSPMDECVSCVLHEPPERAGLLWIGEAFYPTPAEWTAEARRMGVSRRIPALPRDFEAGTWVLVAHRKAAPCPDCEGKPLPEFHRWLALRGPSNGSGIEALRSEYDAARCGRCEGSGLVPGIFHAFRPSAVEYVVKGDEDEESLARMEKRGIKLVRVIPIEAQVPLDMDEKEARP